MARQAVYFLGREIKPSLGFLQRFLDRLLFLAAVAHVHRMEVVVIDVVKARTIGSWPDFTIIDNLQIVLVKYLS